MHTVPAWLIAVHWHEDHCCVDWKSGSVHSCSVTVIGLGVDAGTESGRSSPYYNQLDARSSTPTTNQAPKHFHVPGRPCLDVHFISCFHLFHTHSAVYLNINENRLCHIKTLWRLYNCWICLYYTPVVCRLTLTLSSTLFLRSLETWTRSSIKHFLPPHPRHFTVFCLSLTSSPCLICNVFLSSQPQGSPTSTGSLPSIRDMV